MIAKTRSHSLPKCCASFNLKKFPHFFIRALIIVQMKSNECDLNVIFIFIILPLFILHHILNIDILSALCLSFKCIEKLLKT